MAKKKNFVGMINPALQQKGDSETAIKRKITIKEELKNFIPPLSEEEFAQLEENILAEGCRDALILWKNGTEYILVDGHNRYQICSHHKCDFRFELMNFKSIEDVKEWMIANQLGKRNLTEFAKSYLRGKQYNQEKQQGKRTDLTSGQNVQKMETREKLAEQHKVSSKTIQRDEKFALAVDKIVNLDNDLRWKILNKDIDLPKSFIVDLLDKTDKEVQELGKELKKGNYEQAIQNIETPAVPKQKRVTSSPTKIDTLRAEMIKTFKQAAQKKDKEALARLRAMIDALEKMLFE